MTIQELNAELRRANLECLVEALTKWSDEETENMSPGYKWCDGYVEGQNDAKKLIKDLLKNLQTSLL